MGCCAGSEEYQIEEEKRLLSSSPSIQEPVVSISSSTARNRFSQTLPASVVKSLPPVPTLVGQGASTVFHPFTQAQSTTFSLINDAEQQFLDSIVLHAEKQFIDISHHVQQEPLSFDGVREKIEVYRNHLKNGVIGSSPFIVPDFLTVPSIQESDNPSVFQFKGTKLKAVPYNQLSNSDITLMYNVTKLNDLFLSMKVADCGPLLVSFDV